jgi:hypothetical protein
MIAVVIMDAQDHDHRWFTGIDTRVKSAIAVADRHQRSAGGDPAVRTVTEGDLRTIGTISVDELDIV